MSMLVRMPAALLRNSLSRPMAPQNTTAPRMRRISTAMPTGELLVNSAAKLSIIAVPLAVRLAAITVPAGEKFHNAGNRLRSSGRRSKLAAGLPDYADEAPRCRKERDKAGLQGVIDIALAGEKRVGRVKVLGQFLVPAAILAVDEAVGDRAPYQPVAVLVEIVGGQVFVEEVRRSCRLAHRPPQLAGSGGRVVPVERIEEAALPLVPSQ